ncbi:MAG: HD domain-containing protein [Bacteroidetes bacterium]|nr:HD domain-containing protein [Bacteroidota bacterium]
MITRNLASIEAHVWKKLEEKLPEGLYYHGMHHTRDVLESALLIAQMEGITDKEDLFLLHVACLYHDLGFIDVYKGHEMRGCEIARAELPDFGLTEEQIKIICSMIISTRLPQSPATELEQIICDADLYYLGGTDYETVSETLFKEQHELGMIKDRDEWNKIQLEFLQKHHYFTASVKSSHNLGKSMHTKRILGLVNNNKKI